MRSSGLALSDMPEMLTPEEARTWLSIGRPAIYHAVKTGQVYSVKIGRTIRIPRAALARLAEPEVRP